MPELNSTRAALSDAVTQQVPELFDALTLLQAAASLNHEIQDAPSRIDANGITAPHERLDTLLRLAEGKVQGAIRAFNAVN